MTEARRKQSERYARRAKFDDPLIMARNTRHWRTPAAIAAREAEDAARRARALAEIEAERIRSEHRAATRKTLLAAGRLARRFGAVDASRFDGRISSYYLAGPFGRIRISDHLIPATDFRDEKAFAAGRAWGFDGFRGKAEIIIDRPMTVPEIRAALERAIA